MATTRPLVNLSKELHSPRNTIGSPIVTSLFPRNIIRWARSILAKWLACVFLLAVMASTIRNLAKLTNTPSPLDLDDKIPWPPVPNNRERRSGGAATAATLESETDGTGTRKDFRVEANDATSAAPSTLRLQKETPPRSRQKGSAFCYMFLLGGIHEIRTAHEGFLYGVLVSVSILRRLGSEADFVVWTQLASDSSMSDNELPPRTRLALERMGIEHRPLPKPADDSFARVVYEKFHALDMTEYSRVMFLDCDLMPLVNLDYIFDLTTNGVLRPNVILATEGEPANAGWFVLEPVQGDFYVLNNLLKQKLKEGALMPYPYFDMKIGFGHNFEEAGDEWEAIRRNGTRWRFWAGWSDQGLLYYWTKYHKQDVSCIIGSRVLNYGPNDDYDPTTIDRNNTSMPKLVSAQSELLDAYAPEPLAKPESCNRAKFRCIVPYNNWKHFAGKFKPWQNTYDTMLKNFAGRLWFSEIEAINEQHGLGIDVRNIPREESPLGYAASFGENAMFIMKANETTKADENQMTLTLLPDEASNKASPAVSASSTTAKDYDDKPPVVAYAISLIKCGNYQTHSAGLTDASLILRHSIHRISVRNPQSGSRYDYKMYAIVHRQAEACSAGLKRAGFEIIVVDPPVARQDIRGEFLREHIQNEWCCGSDEFIKLYAYTLPEDIVVHVDIDFAFYKPMDHLFDAILYGKDTPQGEEARQRIERERPTDEWPAQIDAFLTRDWPQVAPNKFPPGYQAGFLVARRNPDVVEELKSIILEGNYTHGWGYGTGWGGLGYGGYVGAMAMQGLMAYYYDHVRRGTSVELNQCRHNHMGMDVRYNKDPNFRRRFGRKGQCRNASPDDLCEDCMVTDWEKIYSVHYTMCRKPWQCQANGYPGGQIPSGKRKSAINTDTVNLDHCLELVRNWHELRKDFEDKLYNLTKDETVRQGAGGSYRPDIFLGHCKEDGNAGYFTLSGNDETYERVDDLYK